MRMSDALTARMHTLELDGSSSTEIVPTDMTNGPDDMGMDDMGSEPEMMTDPMGDMEMETPAQDEMPGDSDMEDYAAVMNNEPEVEESYSPGDENEEGMVSNCCGAPIMDVYDGHGRCSDCKEMAQAIAEESVKEAEYQGRKVQLSKPKRGGSKKFYVYVRNPKTKKIKKVAFGAAGGGGNLAVKLKDPKARKAFSDRHNCEQKNDKTKPGYWSCRLPRYAKSLGLSGGGTWW